MLAECWTCGTLVSKDWAESTSIVFIGLGSMFFKLYGILWVYLWFWRWLRYKESSDSCRNKANSYWGPWLQLSWLLLLELESSHGYLIKQPIPLFYKPERVLHEEAENWKPNQRKTKLRADNKKFLWANKGLELLWKKK